MVREKAIRELEDLPGIGEASTEKLKSAGITTLESVAVLSPHELSEISGINVEAAKKAIAAAKSATHIEYETAAAVSKKREELGKITTNSKNLNELIGGGGRDKRNNRGIRQVCQREDPDRVPAGSQCATPKEQGGSGRKLPIHRH